MLARKVELYIDCKYCYWFYNCELHVNASLFLLQVITGLPPPDEEHQLSYGEPGEQRKLLLKVDVVSLCILSYLISSNPDRLVFLFNTGVKRW